MNAAFRRGHAIDSAESLATIVVTHLVLIMHFRENNALNHWKKEIRGFIKAFRRLDNGKSGKHNFTEEYLQKILMDVYASYEEKETIVSFIEASKDMSIGDVENIKWEDLEDLVHAFSESVMDLKIDSQFTTA